MNSLHSAPGNDSIDFEPGLKPGDFEVESPAEHSKRMEELSKKFDLPQDVVSESKTEVDNSGRLISSYEAALKRHGGNDEIIVKKESFTDGDSVEVQSSENIKSIESQKIEKLAKDFQRQGVQGILEDYTKRIKGNQEALDSDYYKDEKNKDRYANFIDELKKEVIEKTPYVIFCEEFLNNNSSVSRESVLAKTKEKLGEDFNESDFSEIFDRLSNLYIKKDPKEDTLFKMLVERGGLDVSEKEVVDDGIESFDAKNQPQLEKVVVDEKENITDSNVAQKTEVEQKQPEVNPDRILLEISIEDENEKREELNKLYQQGILKKLGFSGESLKDGDDLICEFQDRKIVLADVNGISIPFYCSSKGTDGKKQGSWYPFFGFGVGKWFIKGGSLSAMENGYGSPRVKEIMNTLNNSLGSINSHEVQGVTFFGNLGKKFDEESPVADYINGLIRVPSLDTQFDLNYKMGSYLNLIREIMSEVEVNESKTSSGVN